jgi:hypothetical protein
MFSRENCCTCFTEYAAWRAPFVATEKLTSHRLAGAFWHSRDVRFFLSFFLSFFFAVTMCVGERAERLRHPSSTVNLEPLGPLLIHCFFKKYFILDKTVELEIG